MKLDLEARNVLVVETTMANIRSYLDGCELNEMIGDLDTALDEAQAQVYGKSEDSSYVVIQIKP